MDKKQLKIAFDKLTMSWETESNSVDLYALTDKELEYYMDFQKEVHNQESEKLPDTDAKTISIITELKSNSCDIVNFIINDLLDLRVEKIISNCRNLNRIEENLLTSSEIEFYRNLMSAFKGYNKIRNVYDSITENCRPESNPICDTSVNKSEEAPTTFNPIKLEYIAFYALDNIPPLKGIDFLNYGPYKKEDIGILPKLNAVILEKENLIKMIGN
jgi:hypothetical protein